MLGKNNNRSMLAYIFLALTLQLLICVSIAATSTPASLAFPLPIPLHLSVSVPLSHTKIRKIISLRGGRNTRISKPVPKPNDNDKQTLRRYQGLLYCALLSVQFGTAPILSSRFVPPEVSKTSIVIITELVKICLSCLMLFLDKDNVVKDQTWKSWSVWNSVKVAAVPAFLYAVNNVLSQHGYSLLDAVSFNVINQTKTLFAVFWLWVILKQEQSPIQLFSLSLLIAAPCILYGTPEAITAFSFQSFLDYFTGHSANGVFIVLAASFISGLAAALTQKSLSGENALRNTFLFSAEMAVYGIVFLILSSVFSKEGREMISSGFFSHWTVGMIFPILTNAIGGIAVGLVVRHSGTVAKGFALIVGLLLSTFMKWIFQGVPLRINDFIAAMLVSISIYLHTSSPPRKNNSSSHSASTNRT